MSKACPGLLDEAARRPLVLDAALGSRLIARGLDLGSDDPALWNVSHPEAVAEAHGLDVAAGCDALLTNTFGANRRWLERFGRASETIELNRRAVALARSAARPGRYVIGSIGPTCSDAFTYREQAEALADAGVDAIALETHRLDDALAALESVRPTIKLPLIVSLFRWDEPVGPSIQRLEDSGASVIGGNCQRGMAAALEDVEKIGPLTLLPLWVKPSAGLPGETPDRPESFAASVPRIVARGVRFIGGCCGTTEAHVAAIRRACYDLSRTS